MSVSSNDSFEQLSDMEPDFVASDDSFQDAVEELKELKEQKEAMEKAMESELERIKVATEEKEGVIEDLSKKVEKLAKERDLAVSEFADLYEELKDQKQASEDAQLDMRHEMDALKGQIKEKDRNIEVLKFAQLSLLDKVGAFRVQLKNRPKAEEYAALVKERDSMVLEVSKLTEELEDCKWNSENAQQHLTREIEDLKAKKSAWREEKKAILKRQVDQLTKYEVLHIQETNQHNTEKVHLNQKIENLQDVNAELIAHIETQGQEIVALKAERSEAEKRVNNMQQEQEKEKEDMRKALEYLKAYTYQRREMSEQLEAEMVTLRENAAIAKLKDALDAKERDIEALKTENSELSTKLYEQEKELEKVEEERELVVQEFAKLCEELKEKKDAEQDLLQELQELDALRMKQDDVCAETQEDLEAANSYIQVLQADNCDLTKRLKEQEKEQKRNEVLTQMNSLKEQLEARPTVEEYAALLQKQERARSDCANLYSELLATRRFAGKLMKDNEKKEKEVLEGMKQSRQQLEALLNERNKMEKLREENLQLLKQQVERKQKTEQKKPQKAAIQDQATIDYRRWQQMAQAVGKAVILVEQKLLNEK